MTERRRARMRIRRQRIYVVRRIVVAVCALLCCVLAVFSTIDAQRVWPRGESVAQGQAEVQGQAQKVSQSAQQSASRVSASASSLGRQQVPVFNQAIQEQRDKEAQRARWTNPTGKQPDLSQYSDLSVKVSIAKQEVYVQSGGETIYTMIASTGLNDTTPRGNYVIGMRGDHFYNPAEGMGADYWVRFNGRSSSTRCRPGRTPASIWKRKATSSVSRPHMVACDSLWPMPNGSTTKFRKARRSPSPEAWPEIDTEAIVL